MEQIRQMLIEGIVAHNEGIIMRAKANIAVYLNHSVGIGEHSDISEAIEGELDKIASANDRIEMLDKYFSK